MQSDDEMADIKKWIPEEGFKGPDQILPADDYSTCSPEGTVKLYNNGSRYPIMSIPGLLHSTARKYSSRTALITKPDISGERKMYTFREYEEEVRITAKAFLKLGLQRHYGVAIIGFNNAKWVFSHLGAIYAGGISAGMYTTSSSEACLFICESSRANIVVVEDDKQLRKIIKIREKLPELKVIVQYHGVPRQKGVLSWRQLREIGEKETDGELDAVQRTIGVNECCALVYTSGTVGNPKGVMMSHDNLYYEARAIALALGVKEAEENVVSYLPLSHIAAQLMDIMVPIYAGTTVHFADANALKGTLVLTLLDARPTMFLGVPRVWEKMYEKLTEVSKHSNPVKAAIFNWARAQAHDYYNNKLRTGVYHKTWSYLIAHFLVFNKIKSALGLERSHVFAAGAAPLSEEVLDFFASLDVPILDTYGMSESSGPCVMNTENTLRFGSTGTRIGEVQIMIDNPDRNGEGEICMFGRTVFMGYIHEPEKTKEAKDSSGWLHSGDTGKFDEDGFLYLTGRIKELIITAGGENIPPVNIEHEILAQLPALNNAFVIGDKRKYLTALVTIKTYVNNETGEPMDIVDPEVKTWAKSLGVDVSTVTDILADKNEVIFGEIQAAIDRANEKAVSNAQKVQKFRILPHDFSVISGELGPTLKVRRNIVHEKYAEIIEEMYEEDSAPNED